MAPSPEPEPGREPPSDWWAVGILLVALAVFPAGWSLLKFFDALIVSSDEVGSSVASVQGEVLAAFGLAGATIALLWLAQLAGARALGCVTSVLFTLLVCWMGLGLGSRPDPESYVLPSPGFLTEVNWLTAAAFLAGVALPISVQLVRAGVMPNPIRRFRRKP